jgi:hypothetical protein
LLAPIIAASLAGYKADAKRDLAMFGPDDNSEPGSDQIGSSGVGVQTSQSRSAN